MPPRRGESIAIIARFSATLRVAFSLGATFGRHLFDQGVGMNEQLQDLLRQASGKVLTPEQMVEQRIQLAAANGHLVDTRINVETVKATRTIMMSAESAQDPHPEPV